MKIKYILFMLSFSSLMSMDKADTKDFKTFEELLAAKIDPNAKYYEAMIDAIMAKDVKAVEDLLKQGVNPNKEYYGIIPLSTAVSKSNEILVRLLLKYGANPNIHGSMKRAPFAMAFLHGNMTIIGLLWKAGGIVDEALICMLEKFVKMPILKLEVLFFLQRIAPSGLSGRVRALINQRILRELHMQHSHIPNKMENFETAIQLMRGKQ